MSGDKGKKIVGIILIFLLFVLGLRYIDQILEWAASMKNLLSI
jgi:hypothetical protein